MSLEHKLVPVRLTKEVAGWLVPWEVNGYFEDYEKSGRLGGLFDLSHWGFVEIEGPDAADYLQRMSTWNVKTAEKGRAYHAAFLTGRANPIAMGFFEKLSDEKFLLTFPPGQAAIAAEHIEKFHFAEQLTVTDQSAEWALFGLWSPVDALCADLGFRPDAEPLRIQSGIFRDDSRPALFWVRIKRETTSEFFSRIRAHYVELLGYRLFEYYRIDAAVPQVGAELSESAIILEGNFDRAVARNKGCYPGQEVVERIFTYGQVNKKLWPVALETEGTPLPTPPFALLSDGREAGSVVSTAESPDTPYRAVGLAYINKHFWENNEFQSEPPGVSIRRRDQGQH